MTDIGVEALDTVILEPIEPGSAILVYGVPESRKELLCQQFVFSGLEQGLSGFFVLTNQSPTSIGNSSVTGKLTASDFLSSDKLRLIDVYSWRLKRVSGWIEEGPVIISEATLTSVSIAFVTVLERLKKMKVRGVFDNLSSLLMQNSLQDVHRFLELVVTRCRTHKATTFFLLDELMFDSATIAAIKHLMDGSIRVSMQEDEGKLSRYLRVENLKGANFSSELVKLDT